MAAFLALASVAFTGCTTSDPGEPAISASSSRPAVEAGGGVEYARAKKVLERHKDTIWQRYRGVQGFAIESALDARDRRPSQDPIFRIVIFVGLPANVPATPESIEGVPVRFKVSGVFTAQPAPGG
ncbi:hypothetical protein ACIHCQ_33320 [Streptomyces sp. NPDC052236]|uniref:hypothetical protein n=1 Tax=Streptomyces sp. NPDC052236 TaxID=3365686 RepID=UPI0037CD22E6